MEKSRQPGFFPRRGIPLIRHARRFGFFIGFSRVNRLQSHKVCANYARKSGPRFEPDARPFDIGTAAASQDV